MNVGERLVRANLVSPPLFATADEYARAGAEIEACLHELPAVLAIYRTGRVSAPGISDLDLIAVIKTGSTVPRIWDDLSPRTRYIAMHTPFLVDVDSFRRHRWFAHLAPLEHVWGDHVELEAPGDHELMQVLGGVEGLAINLTRLAKKAATSRVKVRSTLCELHSVHHDLTLLHLDRTDAKRAWAMVDDVDALRRAWFELAEADALAHMRGVLASAFLVISQALAASAGLLCRGFTSSSSPSRRWGNITVVSRSGCPTFVAKRNPMPPSLTGRSHKLAELQWRLGRYELSVPPSVLSIFDTDAARMRHELVTRYRSILARSPGYSAIGSRVPWSSEYSGSR